MKKRRDSQNTVYKDELKQNNMKVLRNLSTVLVGMMLAACSTETREEKPTGPDSPGGDGQEAPRQEVQVTFQNRLSAGTTPQPAAGSKEGNVPTTTEATGTQPVENQVTSLDMYVFGSTTEDGVYTFQERFAYREDPAALPAGATELKLESATGDGTQTTALLNLQKGLFVKLYCIVNQPKLVNPADETKPVGDADFKPLELAEPGKAGSAVKTAGTPELTAFETFHTPLIDPASANDTLACPLPMSGSAGKALDLTDYAVTTRIQADIELTRLVARFDISNNSELSRFTIESVSISNGRKGANFFPVKVYGTLPDAASGDLVTYPERKFHGARANLGIRTSAFYCYPSLLSDGAQLVLKGKYRKSETESIDVSYPVRFASSSDATGTPLAVHPDRRYALVIMGADSEHLDFVLQEFDWSDSGELDDYDSQANPDEVNVTVPEDFQADTEWDSATSTVSMSLKEGNRFAVTVTGSEPALVVAKTYAGDNPDYDWLAVSEPVVSPQTKALPAFGYTYTFSLKEGYTLGRYPKATIRFIDGASGRENEFSVTPRFRKVTVTKEGVSVPADNKLENTTLTLYKLPETTSTMQIKLVSFGGSKLRYEGTGLTLSDTVYLAKEAVCTLTATGAGTGTLKVMNYADTTQFTEYTVTVTESALAVQSTNIDLNAAAGQTATNRITACPLGYEAEVTWGDGTDAWFDITSANPSTATGEQDIALMVKSGLSNAAVIDTARITLKNKITAGGDISFTVAPVWQAPVLETTNGSVIIDETVSVSAQAYGGITATSSNTSIATVEVVTGTGENIGKEYIRITGIAARTTEIMVKNRKDENKTTTYTSTVIQEYVTINGVKWAEGNLVAKGEHGCKIGAPTEIGLYFRFGSLIGYDSGGNSAAAVVPVGFSGGRPQFTNSPYTESGEIGNDDVQTGKGDPCRYYLGAAWRMPTEDESRLSFTALGSAQGGKLQGQITDSYNNVRVPGIIMYKTEGGPHIFLPITGVLDSRRGTLESASRYMGVWVVSGVDMATLMLNTYNSAPRPEIGSLDRVSGLPVRCVHQ